MAGRKRPTQASRPEGSLQTLEDLASEVVARGSRIRAEVADTGEAGSAETRRVTSRLSPTVNQRDSPIFRIRTIDKQAIEEMAFRERDSRGNRKTITTLMDEAVEVLIKSRELDSLAELQGVTVRDMVFRLIDEALKKRPRSASSPAHS